MPFDSSFHFFKSMHGACFLKSALNDLIYLDPTFLINDSLENVNKNARNKVALRVVHAISN